MHRVVIAALLSILACPAQAVTLYRCPGPDGTIIFSDHLCGPVHERIDVQDTYTPGTGLRESERRMLQQIEQREAYRSQRQDFREDRDRMYEERERADNLAACRNLDRLKALGRIRPADYTYQRRGLGCL